MTGIAAKPLTRDTELPLLMRATEALLLAASDEDAVLTTALDLLGAHFGYGSRSLLIYDHGSGELAVAKAAGIGADRPDTWAFRTRPGRGLTGVAAASRAVVNVGNVRQDPRYIDVVKECVSEICVPLVVRDELIGVLAIDSPGRDAFSERDEEVLRAFSQVTALALLHARAIEEAQRLATTDQLTGLFNKRYFTTRLEEEIARATRYARELSLIIVDSDALKRVNDRFGHVAGDELLVALARTLRQQVRASDVVARYGGDEFVILQPETGIDNARATAERIRVAAYTPARQGDVERSVSAGVATYPLCARDGEELFRRADEALYSAKRHGKHRIEAADPI